MSLRLDDRGLFFAFPVPNTIDGQRAAERVKRGDIQGCSFEFSYSENECKYTRSEDGPPLRTLNNIHQISDICLTSRPVYPSTTVNRRSLDELKEFDSEAYVKKLRNSINN